MEIVFRNPFYLWALVVIPLIIIVHFISLNYSKKRAIKFVNFIALARVSEKVHINSNFLVLFLRVIVFIAIVLSISGTTVFYEGSRVDADYVIAIDSSASMLAEDFSPTRFDATKGAAREFIESLPIYSSIGIVSFSGTSYVLQPLTIDKILLKSSIDKLEILVSGGTSIGDAVITGTNLLMNSGKPKVIILLTDGRSNIGISTNLAITYANENNVIVNTIGIGTEESYFLNLNVSEQLGPLGVDLNALENIAVLTGGKFYHAESDEDLKNIYSEIAQSKKTKVSLDLTLFLLLFILIVLVLEWVLINTKYRVIP